MYKIIDENNKVYSQYVYTKEAEFERMVVANAEHIFGKEGIYFDIKKKIGINKKGAAIPDGYYLDLTFHNSPCLYLVEVELNSHDVYGHIGEQILRFGISSETDKYRIKNHLLEDIAADSRKREKLEKYFLNSKYNNINELLDKVIFDNKPAAIIIIDEATEELYRVLGQLTMNTEVIKAQTYCCQEKKLHRFTPFKDDLFVDLPEDENPDELDTVVVSAREEAFNEIFIQNNQWYAIRISSAMIDKLKHIAAYQVAPISGITYIADIEHIEKYQDTNKYIVFFKNGSLRKINKIPLGNKKGCAPQAPRYSSYERILKAKSLDDLWNK